LEDAQSLGFRQRRTPHNDRRPLLHPAQSGQPVQHGMDAERLVHQQEGGPQFAYGVHAICQRALRRDNAQLLCRFQKKTSPNPFYGNRLCIANRNGYQAFPFDGVDSDVQIRYRLKRQKL